MTNLLKSAPLRFALTLLFELYAVTAGEAQVQNASKTGVSVSYSLPTAQLSLHEPIVINFQVNNETTQAVGFDLGQDRKGEFLFTVTSPDGATLHLPQYMHEGISQYGTVSVQKGESFSQSLLLNEWYDNFNVLGKYILSARLTKPIVVGETPQLDSGFTGEIYITHRDPARLEKVCAGLAMQVETAANPEAAQKPALMLSYIEDPIAVPYLARVLATKTLTSDKAIAGLKRIGNDAAVEELLSALNKNGHIADEAAHALSQMLDKISDARLKETVNKAVERTTERERNEFIQTQIVYLGYRDPNLQHTAIQELVRVENGLKQAEPALQRLVDDPNQPSDVRDAAKDALQRLHPPPR